MPKLNEVEVYLELVQKMLTKKLEEKENGGLKISYECKMKYRELLRVHNNVRRVLLDSGQIRAYDICQNCKNFTQDEEVWYSGLCTTNDRDIRSRVNCYHTCFRNTSTRWTGKTFDYAKYPSEEKSR